METATHIRNTATTDAISAQPTPSSGHGKDGMATLFVGEEEQELPACGMCLSSHSEFFKAALKKEWVEGQTRTVKLPEEYPEIVALYLDFLYGRGLPTDSVADSYCGVEVYDVLTELFALGERVMDSAIRNAVIKEIVRLIKVLSFYPSDAAINNIYNATTASSPARRMLVDYHVCDGNTTWMGPGLHPDFYRELAVALMTEIQSSSLPCRLRGLMGGFQGMRADDYLV
jgi:hypothetical protein